MGTVPSWGVALGQLTLQVLLECTPFWASFDPLALGTQHAGLCPRGRVWCQETCSGLSTLHWAAEIFTLKKKGAAQLLNVFGARGPRLALEFSHTHLHLSLWAAVQGQASLLPNHHPWGRGTHVGTVTLAIAPLRPPAVGAVLSPQPLPAHASLASFCQ